MSTGMIAPEAFVDALARVDANLFPWWDQVRSRWQIRRRNPKRPNNPPDIVCVVCEKDGTFRPLDNRTIEKLYRMDSARRFTGDVKYHGMKVQWEMDEEQAKIDREKERRRSDMHGELMDRLHFNFKEWERHGKRVS